MKYLVIYQGLGVGVYDIEADDEETAADGALQRYGMTHDDGDTITVVSNPTITKFNVDVPAATVRAQ